MPYYAEISNEPNCDRDIGLAMKMDNCKMYTGLICVKGVIRLGLKMFSGVECSQ